VAQESGSMRTSTQRPRTTDHGAGRAGLVILLSKRRQNSGRNKAEHILYMYGKRNKK